MRFGGREIYFAWLLHRLSGVAIILFLFLHVVDTSLVGFGPGAYDTFVAIYRFPPFRVLEVALVAAVLYHGINGVRIILVDFVENTNQVQRQLWWLVWLVFLVMFLPAALVMLRPVVGAMRS
ncbi:MAG: succinate dehydrogenase, cytochrome b556 subunit [Chloroflexi bacterium]|nr:succinate dehydrogenase, cytochrome b556 subunit [Chloroflexota bacterium]